MRMAAARLASCRELRLGQCLHLYIGSSSAFPRGREDRAALVSAAVTALSPLSRHLRSLYLENFHATASVLNTIQQALPNVDRLGLAGCGTLDREVWDRLSTMNSIVELEVSGRFSINMPIHLSPVLKDLSVFPRGISVRVVDLDYSFSDFRDRLDQQRRMVGLPAMSLGPISFVGCRPNCLI